MAIKFEDKDEPGAKRAKQPAPAPATKVATDEVPPKLEAKSAGKRKFTSGR